MVKVTISAKYQVVIPKEIRQLLNLKRGQKMIVLVKDGIINLLKITNFFTTHLGRSSGIHTQGSVS